MTPDQWLVLIPVLVTAVTTVLVVGIPAMATYYQAKLAVDQSRKNEKAIAENTAISIQTGHAVDGRITEMLAKIEEANAVQRQLAVTVERMAGNERTVAAVQDERVAALARSVAVTAEIPKTTGETPKPAA